MNQQELVKGLTRLNNSVEALFSEIQPDQLQWQARDNMWKLIDLANHLAQIPSTDLAIPQGATREQIQEIEHSLRRENPAELFAVWQAGAAKVKAYYESMSAEDFETKVTQAFYGQGATQQEWLLEMITHAYHHRAQLFTYLKMLGRPIDMFTLYK